MTVHEFTGIGEERDPWLQVRVQARVVAMETVGADASPIDETNPQRIKALFVLIEGESQLTCHAPEE